MKRSHEPLDDDRPRHFKKATKRQKKFGIEQYSRWFDKWYPYQWYTTAKTRDQALDDLRKHVCNILRDTDHAPQYRKVDR